MIKKNLMLLLFLAIACMVSCEQDNDPQNIEEVNLTATLPSSSNTPKVLLSIDDAKAMMDTYNDDISRSNIEDAPHFVDFDYKDLKEYLLFIESQSKEANVEIEALRFYFAQYPSQYPSGKTPKDVNKKSLFYNPVTAFPGLIGNMSYAIQKNVDGTSEAVTVGSILDMGKSNDTDVQSLAGDDLEWPPPPYPNDPNDYH